LELPLVIRRGVVEQFKSGGGLIWILGNPPEVRAATGGLRGLHKAIL
jgi:hypothetical protein